MQFVAHFSEEVFIFLPRAIMRLGKLVLVFEDDHRPAAADGPHASQYLFLRASSGQRRNQSLLLHEPIWISVKGPDHWVSGFRMLSDTIEPVW